MENNNGKKQQGFSLKKLKSFPQTLVIFYLTKILYSYLSFLIRFLLGLPSSFKTRWTILRKFKIKKMASVFWKIFKIDFLKNSTFFLLKFFLLNWY